MIKTSFDMRTLLPVGRNIFALGLMALAVLGLMYSDFIIGRPPKWPDSLNLNPALSYISNSLMVMAGLAILINRKAKLAAGLIAILVVLLSLSRHLPNFMQDWLNSYKTFALVGGSLIVAASFDIHTKRATQLVWIGSLTLSIFFVASGYAHFKFADFVAGFIPTYIPFHNFFAYFTAICLIAGGLGLLVPATRKYAALLSGVMLAGWFLLLHIPRFIADSSNMSDRMGLFESFTFAGIFFVLAAMEDVKKENDSLGL